MDNVEEKYKIELDAVKKYIDNPYIYKIIKDYGFIIDGKFVPLDSNINVYEACFISLLINIYIKTYKTNDTLNILEVGLAYGTSALMILNQLLQYNHKRSYTVIDPNQSKQWQNIGKKNIDLFVSHMGKTLDYQLIQKYSTDAMPKLKKKYDVCFIDGSHEEAIVIKDLINADEKLVVNGLIIADDCRHLGVRKAILSFWHCFSKCYKRVSVDATNMSLVYEPELYDNRDIKKSFTNPNTMFCFQKIADSCEMK